MQRRIRWLQQTAVYIRLLISPDSFLRYRSPKAEHGYYTTEAFKPRRSPLRSYSPRYRSQERYRPKHRQLQQRFPLVQPSTIPRYVTVKLSLNLKMALMSKLQPSCIQKIKSHNILPNHYKFIPYCDLLIYCI